MGEVGDLGWAVETKDLTQRGELEAQSSRRGLGDLAAFCLGLTLLKRRPFAAQDKQVRRTPWYVSFYVL